MTLLSSSKKESVTAISLRMSKLYSPSPDKIGVSKQDEVFWAPPSVTLIAL